MNQAELKAAFRAQLDDHCRYIDELDGMVTLIVSVDNPNSESYGTHGDELNYVSMDMYDNTIEDTEGFLIKPDLGSNGELTFQDLVDVLEEWMVDNDYHPTGEDPKYGGPIDNNPDLQLLGGAEFNGKKLSPRARRPRR